MSQRNNSRLESLQAMRALAAGVVVLAHLYSNALDRGIPVLPPQWFEYGTLGVDVFFVLSGWIIVHVHQDDVGQAQRVGAYAWRRFSRVWPLLAVLTTAKLALSAFAPGAVSNERNELSNIVTSYLCLPHWDFPVIRVAWTLRHEVLFYGLFALGIWWGRRALTILALGWVALIISAQFVERGPWLYEFLGSAYNLHFLLGCLAALWLRRYPHAARPSGWTIVGLLVLMLGAVAVHDLWHNTSYYVLGHLPLGVVTAALIVSLVRREEQGGMRIPRLLSVFGDASYSVYLWHGFMLGGMCWLWTRLPTSLQAWPVSYLVLTFLVTMASSWVLYRCVERPLLRAMR